MEYVVYLYSQWKGLYTKKFSNFHDYYVFLNKVAHSNYVDIVKMYYNDNYEKEYIDKIVWHLRTTGKWE